MLKLPAGFPPDLAIKIVQKGNLRHLKMRFDCKVGLIVNLPRFVRKKTCEEFIEANLQWILTHFENSRQYQEEIRWNQFYLFGQWVEFDTLRIYLDKDFLVSLQKTLQKWDSSLENLQESLLVQKLWQALLQGEILSASSPIKVKFKSLLIALYQKALESYVSSRIGEISQAMQLFPCEISYGKSYRQLGCCKTKKQSIRLSLRLALMPFVCIDSVIIHELAHLRYPNHQQDFWNLVRKFDTNPQSIKEWLHLNSYLNAQLYQCIFR
ncbi:YgjP-like metallopeptidase domain-containing protein [uncultured Helicobacter sp.]|uniref:YgjP-like metallopeptidase domain-containing protein n=1 Tax=uncultured Helicobacter sp. TaxID=175537 RepID=UPI0026195845|nr:YgjP-like metallopeptidase domain-containing protein [uncultured Helicobacter sp.]